MKRLLFVLLVFVAGCSLQYPGYQGIVSAINFVPEKSPNPWVVYFEQDGQPIVVYLAHKPGFKTGDHVTEFYNESGQPVELRRTRQ